MYSLMLEAETVLTSANELEFICEQTYFTEGSEEGFFAKIIRKIGECIQKLKDFLFGSKMKNNLDDAPATSNAEGKKVETEVKNSSKELQKLVKDASKAKTAEQIDELNTRHEKIKENISKTLKVAGIGTTVIVGTTFIKGLLKSITADAESVKKEADSVQSMMNKASSGQLNKVQVGVWKAKASLLGKIAATISQFGTNCGAKLASKNKNATDMATVTSGKHNIETNKSVVKKYQDQQAIKNINKYANNPNSTEIGDINEYVSMMLDKLDISVSDLAQYAKDAINRIKDYGVTMLNNSQKDIVNSKEYPDKVKKIIKEATKQLDQYTSVSRIRKAFVESEDVDNLYAELLNNDKTVNANNIFSFVYKSIKGQIDTIETTAIRGIDTGVVERIYNLPQLPKKSSGKRVKTKRVKPIIPKPMEERNSTKYKENGHANLNMDGDVVESTTDLDILLSSYL